MNGTVKQFKDTIEEMRTIYNFDDEKARLSTYNIMSCQNNSLQLYVVDEKTGIKIVMEKQISSEEN